MKERATDGPVRCVTGRVGGLGQKVHVCVRARAHVHPHPPPPIHTFSGLWKFKNSETQLETDQ